MLDVRLGITGFSSIVFSDEGDILAGSENPDLRYNQVIRPWKSRLGLLYIRNQSFFLDIIIILLTVVAILSKRRALNQLHKVLAKLGADDQLVKVSLRQAPLEPYPPPGANRIVEYR